MRATAIVPASATRARPLVAAIGVCVLLAGGLGTAFAVTVTPMQGQTSAQAATDQQQCAAQASSQSGYDPSAPAPTPQVGQRAAGAVRGAAAGKVVSNVTKNSTDDAMEGGAKLGAMASGSRQRRDNREQRQQTQQQASVYNNAFSACLQARGYSVQ